MNCRYGGWRNKRHPEALEGSNPCSEDGALGFPEWDAHDFFDEEARVVMPAFAMFARDAIVRERGMWRCGDIWHAWFAGGVRGGMD
mgnify:CR=1 FL=1